jgi:hypothetical protein
MQNQSDSSVGTQMSALGSITNPAPAEAAVLDSNVVTIHKPLTVSPDGVTPAMLRVPGGQFIFGAHP